MELRRRGIRMWHVRKGMRVTVVGALVALVASGLGVPPAAAADPPVAVAAVSPPIATAGDAVTVSGSEAFQANYRRGMTMVGDWRLGAQSGNGTPWELATVGRAVRLGDRDWSSIDWYWQGARVELTNPFG
nr:polymorphic toxin type 27 domain-containing protein [Micromonospora sp. DSM 115978]